jgi:hypothetical protein
MFFIKESMRNAVEMLDPKIKIIVLNPILSASLTPKESTELVISPRKGNTIDMNERVTVLSYYFMYAAM